MEALRLQRRIGRDPEQFADRGHAETIAAFEPRAVALALEFGSQIVVLRDAVGGEPVIGEGECAREIRRTEMGDAVNAGHDRVAPPGAEHLRQIPVGAAAGEREAVKRLRRDVIGHAAGKAVSARRDVVRANLGVAVGRTGAAERRTPRRPALASHWWDGGCGIRGPSATADEGPGHSHRA